MLEALGCPRATTRLVLPGRTGALSRAHHRRYPGRLPPAPGRALHPHQVRHRRGLNAGTPCTSSPQWSSFTTSTFGRRQEAAHPRDHDADRHQGALRADARPLLVEAPRAGDPGVLARGAPRGEDPPAVRLQDRRGAEGLAEVAAVIAEADEHFTQVCVDFARGFGVAYQIIDDVHNFSDSPRWTKTCGEDLAGGKLPTRSCGPSAGSRVRRGTGSSPSCARQSCARTRRRSERASSWSGSRARSRSAGRPPAG